MKLDFVKQLQLQNLACPNLRGNLSAAALAAGQVSAKAQQVALEVAAKHVIDTDDIAHITRLHCVVGLGAQLTHNRIAPLPALSSFQAWHRMRKICVEAGLDTSGLDDALGHVSTSLHATIQRINASGPAERVKPIGTKESREAVTLLASRLKLTYAAKILAGLADAEVIPLFGRRQGASIPHKSPPGVCVAPHVHGRATAVARDGNVDCFLRAIDKLTPPDAYAPHHWHCATKCVSLLAAKTESDAALLQERIQMLTQGKTELSVHECQSLARLLCAHCNLSGVKALCDDDEAVDGTRITKSLDSPLISRFRSRVMEIDRDVPEYGYVDFFLSLLRGHLDCLILILDDYEESIMLQEKLEPTTEFHEQTMWIALNREYIEYLREVLDDNRQVLAAGMPINLCICHDVRRDTQCYELGVQTCGSSCS